MEKKSLINTLKTTKKANVITGPAKNEGKTSRKTVVQHARAKRFSRYSRY